MATVFVAQSYSDERDVFFHGVFSTPEKAEADIKRMHPHAELRPSPIRLSTLGRWYWQNEDASLSTVIQETEIQ
jgi:hypothetical protein